MNEYEIFKIIKFKIKIIFYKIKNKFEIIFYNYNWVDYFKYVEMKISV